MEGLKQMKLVDFILVDTGTLISVNTNFVVSIEKTSDNTTLINTTTEVWTVNEEFSRVKEKLYVGKI